MLRSDGRWHDCVLSKWNARDATHLCDWVGDSGAVTPGDWYDCNHPLRVLRFYEDGVKEGTLGALLPEFTLPASVPAASPPVVQPTRPTVAVLPAAAAKAQQLAQHALSTGAVLVTSLTSGNYYVMRAAGTAEEDHTGPAAAAQPAARTVMPAATAAAAAALSAALAAAATSAGSDEAATTLTAASDALAPGMVASQPHAPALAPCVPGGWRALQALVAPPASAPAASSPPSSPALPAGTASGAGLLFARVRVFWPADHRWYCGRVLRWDAGSGQHLVRYDDGDERWYVMAAKQFIVVPPYGAEVVGRKLAVESSHGR